MPIYEFECDNCGKTFEEFCYSYNIEAPNCPYCKEKAHKIVSLPNFKLEGNHWAKDGYGLKDKK